METDVTGGEITSREWGLLMDQVKELKQVIAQLATEVRTLHGDRSAEVRALEVRLDSVERQAKAAFAKLDDLADKIEAHHRAHGLEDGHRPSVWVASAASLVWFYPGRATALGLVFLALCAPEIRSWWLTHALAWLSKAVGP